MKQPQTVAGRFPRAPAADDNRRIGQTRHAGEGGRKRATYLFNRPTATSLPGARHTKGRRTGRISSRAAGKVGQPSRAGAPLRAVESLRKWAPGRRHTNEKVLTIKIWPRRFLSELN